MSQPEPLAPLWKLVEEFHKTADADYAMIDNSEDSANDNALGRGSAGHRCAHELAAALRAWDERLKDVFYVGYEDDIFDIAVEGNWVREKLLGVPASEPAKRS